MSYKWNELEINKLKRNADKMSYKQLSEILPGRTINAVRRMCYNLGLNIGVKDHESRRWSEEEDQVLYDFYLEKGIDYCIILLDRSREAIKKRAIFLGVTRDIEMRAWEEWEEEYVKKHYFSQGAKRIAKKLNRSVYSVKRKASRLSAEGITSGSYISAKYVNQSFNDKSGRMVYRWINKYDLPCLRRKRGKVTYYLIDQEKFWKWAELHKDIIPFDRYRDGSIIPQPKWVKDEMREWRENNLKSRQYKKVTIGLIMKVNSDYGSGMSIQDLCKKYDRSYHSIKHILRRLKELEEK